MDNGTLFIDTFLQARAHCPLSAGYPQGMVVTIENRGARRRRRHFRSACARPHPQPALAPVNALIVVFVDIARALRRSCSSSSPTSACLMWASLLPSYVVLWLVLSLLLAAFAEEDLLGRYPVGAQGSVGGGALDRAHLTPRRCFHVIRPGGAAHGCRR